jgi:hypothetical protein
VPVNFCRLFPREQGGGECRIHFGRFCMDTVRHIVCEEILEMKLYAAPAGIHVNERH